MGWFDGASEVGGHTKSHSSSKSHHSPKHHSTSGSIFGGDSGKKHHSSHSTDRGIFGLGGDSHKHNSSGIFGSGDHRHNSSRSSFFGIPTRSSSHYKRSPRSGYLKRIYTKLRHLLRDLIYYAKRHPMKVFMLVIMPLITGGALTTLLAKFGIRLPAGVEKMFGAAAGMSGGMGAGIGRDGRGGMQFERTRYEGHGHGGSGGGMLDNLGGLAGVMGGAGSAISLAKMFM